MGKLVFTDSVVGDDSAGCWRNLMEKSHFVIISFLIFLRFHILKHTDPDKVDLIVKPNP